MRTSPEFLSVGKSLSLVVGIFVAVVAALLAMNNGRRQILSGVRAYVAGEGLYSKAQKDAVICLVHYAHSHAEPDYDAYLKALAVPLGDRQARLELEKPHPDLTVAYQGFLAARNHPEDVGNMAWLFIRFRRTRYMTRAIDVWTQGDALIEQLRQRGDDLHASIASGQIDASSTAHLLDEVNSLNEQVTALEDEFSRTLGEANRWLEYRLQQITYAVTALLLSAAVFLSWMILRRAREANQTLQTQAERWRVTLASIGDAVVVTDARGAVASLNNVAETLTGWEEEDAIARSLDDVFRISNEQTHQVVESPARRVLREGVIVGLGNHTVLEAKDGTERPIDDSAAPIRDQEGTIIGVVLVFRDVTQRRRAEEALHRSEERYRSLVAVTTSVVWTADAAGAFAAPQPTWETYTGYDWTAHAPEGWLHALQGEDREAVQTLWRRALAERSVFRAEGRIRHAASGQYRYCVAHAVPLLNADGAVREWIGTLTDVDDRRRAEEQASARARLHETIARFGETALGGHDLQSLMDAAAADVTGTLGTDLCEVLELTPDGTQLMLRAGVGWKPGRVGHATVGIEPDSLKGYTLAAAAPVVISDLQTESRFSRSNLLLEHGAISGVSVVIASYGGRPYGVLGCYTTHARSFTPDEVNFLCAMASVLALAIQRKRAEEALQDADHQKDNFLAMLAHEMRNPLSPIRSAVHVLQRLGPEEPRLIQARQMIERQVTHMTRLLDDLLDVSRVARGRISLQQEVVDLAHLVRLTAEDYHATLETAGLALTLIVPEQPLWVRGDPTRLSQAIGNVLHNAVKFSNPGGEVTMQLATEAAGSVAVLSVRDTGIGMEPEFVERVFETFSQADRSLDRSRGGLGLGLALVKGLVEQHGGTVQAFSEGLGKGSKFVIRFPLLPAVAPSRTMQDAPLEPRPARRVLVIEDNPDVAEGMKYLLESDGHAVAVAHTGAAGIESARHFQPDVVLCDIGLPGGMDGFAVAKAIRNDVVLRSAYLIALTGYGHEEERARAAGFDLHLVKPIDPVVLDQVLATLRGTATSQSVSATGR